MMDFSGCSDWLIIDWLILAGIVTPFFVVGLALTRKSFFCKKILPAKEETTNETKQ